MGIEHNNHIVLIHIGWYRVCVWLLGLAAFFAIALGPWGLFAYVGGFLNSGLLWLFLFWAGLAGWAGLLLLGCSLSVRNLRARRKGKAILCFSVALGIGLAFGLLLTGKASSSYHWFGCGVVRRLEMRTSIAAIQTWVESLEPRNYPGNLPSGHQSRSLSKEQQPQVLKCQDGMVRLELDADGHPRVRLSWYGGKGGTWGLTIGHREMNTPPSDPNIYGEKHTELRPGVYFWYVDA